MKESSNELELSRHNLPLTYLCGAFRQILLLNKQVKSPERNALENLFFFFYQLNVTKDDLSKARIFKHQILLINWEGPNK